MHLQIIYTQSAMLLSKKAYASWRDIEHEFPDYITSLGPWEADDLIVYLQDDYPNLAPAADVQVAELLLADSALRELTFLD